MSKLRRYIQSANTLYSKKGMKGLYNAAVEKINNDNLPHIYGNRFLYTRYHPRLSTAFLELTNKCNLHCKMCNWQNERKRGYISRQLFESCVNQFSQLHLQVLNLQFGGESLLHPEFKDMLKYAIEKRDQGKIGCVGWTTNGMLFDESVANLVVSLNVDWINFSLDGVGEVNDNIRLGSKYPIVKKNIEYLLKKRGSNNRPKVLINIVDYDKTEEQKLAFFHEWAHIVDEIELIPAIRPDNTWGNKEDKMSENFTTIAPPKFCGTSLNTIIISWDGKVTYCCFDSELRSTLGDVNKESITKIWNNQNFQKLRRAIITNHFSKSSPCFNCEFWKVNFQPKTIPILDGQTEMECGYIYRRIHKRKNGI